ncbi:MAG: outer membrane lipoprotein chaperone LolA [Deltaproteobacteria bacterium]|nr:outer membrane lipoprotein chaperone LolA [Deltaproteobacteria bacterium]
MLLSGMLKNLVVTLLLAAPAVPVAKPAAPVAAPAVPVAKPAVPVAKPAVPGLVAPASGRLALSDVMGRVQKYYDITKSYTALFEQSQLNAAFGRTRRASGEVLFKKPGRMRWNYKTPDNKTFVSNGSVLWLYEPVDKQAFKQDLKGSQLPAALAFLMGKGKLSDDFDVAFADKISYGRPEDYRLSLRPRVPQSQYKSIYFIVDPTTFHVRQSVLVDAQGNINDITFKDAKVNPKLLDTTFEWKPPQGVRVIDAAKMSPSR